MGNIYFLGQNKKIVVYPFRNQIYRATLEGGQVLRPVLLSGDYLGGLSDAYYKGTVYFSYMNRKREIMIQNVTEQTPEYKLDENVFGEGTACFSPQLVVWKEQLLLFCIIKEISGKMVTLEGIFPFEDRKMRIPETFSEDACYTCQCFGDSLLLSVRESGTYRFFLSEREGEIRELGKELSGQQSVALQGQMQLQDLEAKVKEKEAIIGSVKVQYEDLMNTALQYREEAKKWREKYLTKK